MTKKDYLKFAAAAKFMLDDCQCSLFAQSEICRLIEMWAEILAADNPRFDRRRFLAAAGVQQSR